jgi:hypothetical protein
MAWPALVTLGLRDFKLPRIRIAESPRMPGTIGSTIARTSKTQLTSKRRPAN